MVGYPFTEIYSHPPSVTEEGKLLYDHCQAVSLFCSVNTAKGQFAPDGASLRSLSELVGWAHDLGKATAWFQRHLNNEAVDQHQKVHAPLGALAAFHIARANGASREDALVALTAVAKHHGVLPDVADYTFNYIVTHATRKDIVSQQVRGISSNELASDTVNSIIETASSGETSWSAFREGILSGELYDDISALVQRGPVANHNTCSPRFYDSVIAVWSALVLADKTDAAGLPSPNDIQSTQLSSEFVTQRVAALQQSGDTGSQAKQLNESRDTAREEVVSNSTKLSKGGSVATITLPTGLGKTLTSLETAATLRERPGTQTDGENTGRVIYVLPYTSIVDQTVEEIKEVFAAGGRPVDEYGDALTIHHHLAETTTRLSGDPTGDEEDTDEFAREEYLFGETWQSGVVVTTYVQLFESLVRPSNSQALKLPALRDATIILDEPQTLPLDWWLLVRRVVKTLTEEYSATILSMTATQPHVFTADEAFSDEISFNATELVGRPTQYFETFSRVDYAFDESLHDFLNHGFTADGLSHDVAAEKAVKTSLETEGGSSTLAICNTISSARELSREVSERLITTGNFEVSVGQLYARLLERVNTVREISVDDLVAAVERESRESESPVITLHATTRHRPIDRTLLIEAAKELSTSSTPFIFVSTQLVEAGVDISFHNVFRDIAPLPSIIQAAGRCNRSFEWERGKVTVWRLASPEGGYEPSRLVYANGEGHNLLDVTREALSQVLANETTSRLIPDTGLARIGIEAYYETLVKRQPGNREYVKLLESGEFAALRKRAEYISDRNDRDVVICRTSTDSDLVDEYRSKRDEKGFNELNQLRNRLHKRTISVPAKQLEGVPVTVLEESAHGEPLLLVTSSNSGWWSDVVGASPN